MSATRDAAHLHARRVVGAASLRPSRLSPAAVLCVRRLRDPLRGSLRLNSTALRPPPAWERAAIDALDGVAARAARPALGAVPLSAEAVLFADRAELLAVLARDRISGELAGRWWWQVLLRSRATLQESVDDAWLESPEVVPAALELLAASGHAVRFVAALAPPVQHALLRAVARAHGLGALERERPVAAGGPTASAYGEPAQPPRPVVRARAVRPPAPWRGIVPEAESATLAPVGALLLGIALSLRRAPARARSTAFVAASVRWLEAAVARSHESRSRPHAESPANQAVAAAQALEHGTATAEPGERAPATQRAPTRAQPKASARSKAAPPDTQREERSSRTSGRQRAGGTRAPARQEARVPEPRPPETRAPSTPEDPGREESADVVRTELGGLFYLLNLALHLGLYGDFTRPLERGIRLDPWGFVALIGRELLGRGYDDDAVWALLARLAARNPRTAPGLGFRARRDWRLPPAWLDPFAEDERPWRRATADRRLLVRHPAGFLVLDVPERDGALRRYGEPRCVRGKVDARRAPLRALWVERMAQYARARLELTLGLPVSAVLRQPARVHVSATRVDVVSSLEHLPIEARLAGLDRDPGWIPAAGRDVRFQFE